MIDSVAVFVYAGLLLAGSQSFTQVKHADTPCAEETQEPAPVVHRDLSGRDSDQMTGRICRSLSEPTSPDDPNAHVDHAGFPTPPIEGRTDRLVYYRLMVPRLQKPEWSESERMPDSLLRLSGISSQDLFSITVYTWAGRAVLGTYAPRAEQELLLTGEDLCPVVTQCPKEYVIEVAFENPSEKSTGGFDLRLAVQAPREPTRQSFRSTKPILQANAHRRVVTGPEYENLLDFARCDTSIKDACTDTSFEKAYQLFDRLVPGEPARGEEPIIVFVGAGGVNRIMLVAKSGSGPTDYFPSHFRTLPRSQWFWAAYIEDDLSPFETSIDIEMKPRAPSVDVEEFDPVSLVSLGNRGANNERRVLRVALRRFAARQTPISIEVAFSRLGTGYGLRQWRRIYKLRSLAPVAFGVGAFVPFSHVQVEDHDLVEPGLTDGSVPGFAVISPVRHNKPVFLMGSIYVPSWRNQRDDATTRASRFGWGLVPELVFGVGVPPRRGQALYVGLGWNVAWDRLSFSVGSIMAQESRLRPGYYAGQRLTDKATPWSTYAERPWVGRFVMGATLDLWGLR